MSGFEKHRSGAVIATFAVFEADLIRSLCFQLVELLRDEQPDPAEHLDPLEALFNFSGPVDEPEDPVLLRLFPTAYTEDPEAAGEFRRYTEPALRTAKERNVVLVIDTLEDAGLPMEPEDASIVIDVELDEPSALGWLLAFNDLRLAIATRLGVTDDDEEFWESLPEDDDRSQAHDIYEWLGWLQETLVAAIEA
ncbi:DUF2017 domain-containing protein [Nocardioides yefusunii]|uniref:DUF2017 domain-containing protein n=1 Tax=Nocardioides yefusunii TaxID=2500546 RepID=A0ABW1QVZ8_9ACTN|nr:DUF2017 domain-containing protein [Nocardioides yefusunii]